jgi:hypothetical protein
MNIQKILLATLGGGIALFIAGWLIWGFGLAGLHQAHTTSYEGLQKAVPDMILLVIGQLLWGLLLAVIFNRWAGIKTFATGAKAGAVIAMLATLAADMMNMSMLNWYDWTVVGTNVIGSLVWGAIGGGVVGWILGRGDD